MNIIIDFFLSWVPLWITEEFHYELGLQATRLSEACVKMKKNVDYQSFIRS